MQGVTLSSGNANTIKFWNSSSTSPHLCGEPVPRFDVMHICPLSRHLAHIRDVSPTLWYISEPRSLRTYTSMSLELDRGKEQGLHDTSGTVGNAVNADMTSMGKETYLVCELRRIHGRIAIGFAEHGIAASVLPSVGNLINVAEWRRPKKSRSTGRIMREGDNVR